MNLMKKIISIFSLFLLCSCVNNQVSKKESIDKLFYSSKGFALIYEDAFYKQGVISSKINNEKIVAMHSSLGRNTPIKIINPENSKIIETKIYRKTEYPKIFNVVISKKIATILELSVDDPYIEIIEIKKNKTFIAKEANTFEEEANVAEKAPVDEIKVNDLTKESKKIIKKIDKKSNYVLVISDFYYLDSAYNLKKELMKKMKIDNFMIKEINNKQYRLSVGPFINFNALKSIYISLNNLGFEDLNIYKD